jgi:hypothetical protein
VTGHYTVEYIPSPAVPSEDGQQSFLNLADYCNQPVSEHVALEPHIPIALPQRWTRFAAAVAFRNLCRQHLDDEERAYAILLERGCPLLYADSAWDRYTAFCLTGAQS